MIANSLKFATIHYSYFLLLSRSFKSIDITKTMKLKRIIQSAKLILCLLVDVGSDSFINKVKVPHHNRTAELPATRHATIIAGRMTAPCVGGGVGAANDAAPFGLGRFLLANSF